MRKFSILSYILIAILTCSFNSADNLGFEVDSNFTYFKSINITHESVDLGNNHIEKKLILNKNMEYSFLLQENDCDVIIKIHDEKGKLMMTNYDVHHNVCFNSIVFPCNATKLYTISLDPKSKSAHGLCKLGFRRVSPKE